MRRNRIIVIGLDACDPDLAQQLANGGRLPTLQRLFGKAARCGVLNPVGLFVGALWKSFSTGLRPDRHGHHCWDEIDVKTYARIFTTPPQDTVPFWRALSDAGRRVAVFDVPHERADSPINGIQVAEWGCHDRHFGFHTWPPASASDIDAGFGVHPVLGLDPYAQRQFAGDDYAFRSESFRTQDEEQLLFRGLLEGILTKRKWTKSLLADHQWDLMLTVLGEGHSIGHQQWHLHDPHQRRYDPATVEALGGDPIINVYEELDRSLGEILDTCR